MADLELESEFDRKFLDREEFPKVLLPPLKLDCGKFVVLQGRVLHVEGVALLFDGPPFTFFLMLKNCSIELNQFKIFRIPAYLA